MRKSDAARLIRSRAKTFFLASLFLPAHTRRDVQVVYAYYRTIDDLVDEPPHGWSRTDILTELKVWEDAISERSEHAPGTLCEQVLDIAGRHAIPRSYLLMVLNGARFDLDLRVMETREQLMWYAVQVAGSVGMVMAHMLGAARTPEALDAARDLGVAMQLTNVLRDVGEDFGRGRIYLPHEDLARLGCDADTLRSRSVSPALRTVMSELADEARARYRQGLQGIAYLDPSARFAIYLAATFYGRILDEIVRQDFDVFTRRAHVSTVEKWRLTVPVYVRYRGLVGGRSEAYIE